MRCKCWRHAMISWWHRLYMDHSFRLSNNNISNSSFSSSSVTIRWWISSYILKVCRSKVMMMISTQQLSSICTSNNLMILNRLSNSKCFTKLKSVTNLIKILMHFNTKTIKICVIQILITQVPLNWWLASSKSFTMPRVAMMIGKWVIL